MKLFIHSVRGLSEVVSMMFSIDIPNIFIPPTYPGLSLVHVCDNHFNILTLLQPYIQFKFQYLYLSLRLLK